MNSTQNKKRIVKNTVFLYFRLILMIGIQFYTVPIVMRNLGISDYGLYNVVGGIAALFAFVGSLASGSQRFIAYAIGKNDDKLLQDTFTSTRTFYVVVGVVTLFALEICGNLYLNLKMNVPAGRMFAANCVFQFSVLAFIAQLLYTPYSSAIIAHEKMSIFAYIGIAESLLKLVAVILLQFVLYDKLIIYALLIFLVSILVMSANIIYCICKFTECRSLNLKWDKEIGHSLLGYSVWNSVGVIAGVLRNQGTSLLLNLFFGTVINAAHAIGQQVTNVVNSFINNIYMATRPAITKAYSVGEEEEMWKLVYISSKMAFYLMTALSVPLLLELNEIFDLWLKDYPSYAIPIARILIITSLMETMTNQIVAVFQAENRIKKLQQYSSGLLLFNIPLSYIALKVWSSYALLPYFVAFFISLCNIVLFLYIARKEVGLNVADYINNVLLKEIIVFGTLSIALFVLQNMFEQSLFRLFLIVIATVALCFPIVWFCGLNTVEKGMAVRAFHDWKKNKF